MADLTIVALSVERPALGPVAESRAGFCDSRAVAVPLSLRARLTPEPQAAAFATRKLRRAAV